MASAAVAVMLVSVPMRAMAAPILTADAPVPPPGDFEGRQGDVSAKPISFEGTILLAGADDVNRESTTGGGCPGCRWELILACATNSSGNAADTLCAGASATCAGTGILYRVYLTRPGAPRRQVGTACLNGPGSVVTQVDIDGQLQNAIDRMPLVGAKPTFGQSAAPLVNLATYFIAAGSDLEVLRVPLAGYEMVVTAKPHYTWDFGDGQIIETASGGRRYAPGDNTRTPPMARGSVMHWYRAPGNLNVSLSTTWHASYTLFSATVIDVPAEVTPQADVLAVVVHTGRATLYN